MLAVQSDIAQKLEHTVIALLLRGVEVVDIQRLGDNVADGHAGVQGRVGILEDHGGLLAEFLQGFLGIDFLPVIDDLTGCGLIQMQNRAADGRLAAAGLADQTQGFAAADREGNIVHRLERLGAEKAQVDIEILFEAFDFQKGIILSLRHGPGLLPQ